MKTKFSLIALLFAIPAIAHAQSPLDNDTRICSTESGLVVCRNVTVEVQPKPVEREVEAQPARGRLFFLLDIPANIFSRLAAPPETNREYHPKSSWEYRPAPPAPPGAGKYRPSPNPEALWRYKPKSSFAYTPKRDWTYDRDVFGRLWRANIAHDTRVLAIPITEPLDILLPVGEVR